jgi:succinyl-diaminopimelate desuccinylase
MVNKKRLLSLTRKLISIDSQNPPGNERAIASFVKRYLSRMGLEPRIYSFGKARDNVVAILPGLNSKRSMLITPHLDTVPAGKSWNMNPFSGKIKNGRLYGLGATDCKGNLACALEVLESIIEDKEKLSFDTVFAATADEESGSNCGLIPLLNKGIIKTDAAVILDSDDFHVVVTQKGLLHLTVKIRGKRAHGAYPWLGENAIDCAVNILKDLKAQKARNIRNKYLHPPTVNIGTIKGGDKVNVVADWCEFELDFRFLPGESAENCIRNLKRTIKKYAKKFIVEIQGIQQPYYIRESHSLVAQLKKAILRSGIKPQIEGSEGATVITFFQHKNIPAVATGFGSSGCAHVADEYVKVNNLYKGALVLEKFLKSYKF